MQHNPITPGSMLDSRTTCVSYVVIGMENGIIGHQPQNRSSLNLLSSTPAETKTAIIVYMPSILVVLPALLRIPYLLSIVCLDPMEVLWFNIHRPVTLEF